MDSDEVEGLEKEILELEKNKKTKEKKKEEQLGKERDTRQK